MILPSRERISHPDLQGQLDDVIPDYRAWLEHRGLGPRRIEKRALLVAQHHFHRLAPCLSSNRLLV